MNKWILLTFTFALTLLMGCSKNSSSIRLEVYVIESITEQEYPVSNASVTLKLKDEVHEIGNCNSLGIITFNKLQKSDDWAVSSTYMMNGISYSGSQSGIKTDGRTGISARLYLRN